MALAGWLVVASVLIVPTVVTPELADWFRTIKESVMRAEAIVGGLLIVIAAAIAGTTRIHTMLRERAVVAVITAGLLWTGLAAAMSTHHAHSMDAAVTVVASTAVLVLAWYTAPRISFVILDLLVPVVLGNATLAALQEYGAYTPFREDPAATGHLSATALIDNPNVVGSYMALAAVILAAAAWHVRGSRRWLYAVGAFAAVCSAAISQTRTAVIALVAGMLLLAAGRSLMRTVALITAVAALFAAGLAFQVPAVSRLSALPRVLDEAGLEAASSGRVAPVLAALEMFRESPWTGLGPGTFKFHYMPYKLRVMERHGEWLRGTTATMFGEVHNDHVQLLAEAGVPGYALFLAAIMVVVRSVRDTDSDDPRARVARAMIVPLAGTVFVLCLAQFPLHVAVTRHIILTFAGLAMGWSRA